MNSLDEELELLTNMQDELRAYAEHLRRAAMSEGEAPAKAAAGKAFLDTMDRLLKTTDLKLHYMNPAPTETSTTRGVIVLPELEDLRASHA